MSRLDELGGLGVAKSVARWSETVDSHGQIAKFMDALIDELEYLHTEHSASFWKRKYLLLESTYYKDINSLQSQIKELLSGK